MVNGTPRFEVRKHDPAARRRSLLLAALGVLVLVLLAAGAGYLFGRRSVPAVIAAPAPQPATSAAMAQKIATLSRSEQVARIASEELRQTLADREEEISALRADLAFYARLVGSGNQRSGLSVHQVHVEPIAGSRAWQVVVTLTRNAHRGKANRGVVRLAVEGVAGDKLVLLDWDELGDPQHPDGVPYSFKYFQQLRASIMLPEGFEPNQLRVVVKPEDGDAVQRTLSWEKAKARESRNVS